MNIYNNGNATLTAGDIERVQQRIAELEQKNAELMAQNGILHLYATELVCSMTEENCQELRDALMLTPSQCLNQIKAEAVEKSADWLHSNYPHLANPACGLLTHYAERFKSGE